MAGTTQNISDGATEKTSPQPTSDSPNSGGRTKTTHTAALKRNAFAELMSSKPTKQSKTDSASLPADASHSTSSFYIKNQGRSSGDPRLGLLPYIQHPESFPETIVIQTTPHTVLIRDLYPKATVHLLLLPRSSQHYNLHPHDAFQDDQFLALMRSEAASAAGLAASELARLVSPYSSTCRARNKAMDSSAFSDELPQGRDFTNDIRVGLHAHPSMSHLHIHIISRDMHSNALKHRKHYNSFNTDFFIPLGDYPLETNDRRKEASCQKANLKKDFLCWRCGHNFGNKFQELKKHLDVEYEEWKKE